MNQSRDEREMSSDDEEEVEDDDPPILLFFNAGRLVQPRNDPQLFRRPHVAVIEPRFVPADDSSDDSLHEADIFLDENLSDDSSLLSELHSGDLTDYFQNPVENQPATRNRSRSRSRTRSPRSRRVQADNQSRVLFQDEDLSDDDNLHVTFEDVAENPALDVMDEPLLEIEDDPSNAAVLGYNYRVNFS